MPNVIIGVMTSVHAPIKQESHQTLKQTQTAMNLYPTILNGNNLEEAQMNRLNKRNYEEKDKAILDLQHELNKFCFHDGGGDGNCNGCVLEHSVPCPLAAFDRELVKHLTFMK